MQITKKLHIFAVRSGNNNLTTMNNEFKQRLQDREFSALKDKQRVILKWATGCGKSKMVIDLINHAAASFRKKPVRALFLVAERAHIKNWEEEFDKWQLKRGVISTDVACYASLKKYYQYGIYDIIVLDEAHHIFTDKRLEMLRDMEAPNRTPSNQRVYLLSATLPSAKADMAEEIFGKFTTSTVTLKDAIKDDILPDPKVYVIGMELDDTRHNQKIQIGKNPKAKSLKWEESQQYRNKRLECIIWATEKQKYIYYNNELEHWKRRYDLSKNTFHQNLWKNVGSQRKRYLGELKTPIVKRLLQIFPRKKRYVCFCATVAQSMELSRENTISSKRSSKYNQLIIDAFNAKQINQIYAVGMITEGMNLTDIETGIIVQLDGKERLFVQKFGRICRSDSPVQYIFYYKGTQDEVYLKNALENIDPKFVKYCSPDELWRIV